MILHHDERALKFFTFASATIAREYKFKYFCRFCLFSMFYNSSNFRGSCEYLMCANIVGDFVQFYTITRVSMIACSIS
jgi:hypothetical protein